MSEKFDNFVTTAQSGSIDSLYDGSFGLYPDMQTSVSNWQNNVNKMPGANIIDKLSSASAIENLAFTKTGIPYDRSNIDSMINALSQEYANKRDDTAYSRLFADLKANGINPAVFMSNASAFSTDGGFRSNYNLNAKDQVNSALKLGGIIALLIKLLA